jgi:hypothetical protein
MEHYIYKDGYSTVLKTGIQHAPETWAYISAFLRFMELHNPEAPLDVAESGDIYKAMVKFDCAGRDVADFICGEPMGLVEAMEMYREVVEEAEALESMGAA